MTNNPLSSPQPWKVLQRDLLLSAMPWVNLYREKVELPSGRVLDDFYRVVLPDFVAVVPVTEAGELVMVRGYKHGLGRIALAPPAGLIHAGEEPLAAAQRELLEETGYVARDWQFIGKYVVDGNRQCGTMHLFRAREAYWDQPTEPDDTEELQVELMRPEQVRQAIESGEIGTLVAASSLGLVLALGL
jgi:ADP-ribose pyrophosphatase